MQSATHAHLIALALAGYLQGRLRSPDYVDWVRWFQHRHGGRIPFSVDDKVACDVQDFVLTYTPPLGRRSDLTHEYFSFLTMVTEHRNCTLVAPLIWNRVGLLRGATAAKQADALKELDVPKTGRKRYVAKNILPVECYMRLTDGEVCDEMPWTQEFLNPDKEEQALGYGTNGLAGFKLVHTSGSVEELDVHDGECESFIISREDLFKFYRDELEVFNGITSVQVTLNDSMTFCIPIGELWSKAWVKQLNCCKAI